ncbi:hypothetical protein GDO78_004326 [Eleutherodactylus coqui]|uniref:WAP domain-containing protein n=1 Tax=Eleutherodactylus coqui TaxID=57060 RepID=A0A8J6ESE7_ELECQ|nr:hypothetical protein GDO78_004326 [Eleutherodactylus coqui]
MYEIILGGNKGNCPAQRQYMKAENEICHELCKSKDDCTDGQLCCSDNCHRMCKPPPKEKPGTCPTFELPSSSEPCDSYCSTDAECRENWKCCKKGCGYTCTPTLSDIGKPSTEPKARKFIFIED